MSNVWWYQFLVIASVLVLLLLVAIIRGWFSPSGKDIAEAELDRVVRNNPYGKDLDAKIVEIGKHTETDGIEVVTMQARFRIEDRSEIDVKFTVDFKGPRAVAVHWPDPDQKD